MKMSSSSGVVLCMKCQSSHIDITGWVDRGAITVCSNCGCKGFIAGVSIGRADLSVKQVNEAQRDMAKPKYINRCV